VVTYGAMGLTPIPLPASLLIFKDLAFRGFWLSGGWAGREGPAARARLLDRLAALYDDGTLAAPKCAARGRGCCGAGGRAAAAAAAAATPSRHTQQLGQGSQRAAANSALQPTPKSPLPLLPTPPRAPPGCSPSPCHSGATR
jgi:hypothetical protein